tara:strand:+ start:330 stop:506 length:177 start_codon:yes stop_codon:yes gene_type:complete
MGFKQQINLIDRKIVSFFNFVGNKLKNFPNLSLGEQISYPAVGLGLLLILTSIVLFIV